MTQMNLTYQRHLLLSAPLPAITFNCKHSLAHTGEIHHFTVSVIIQF